MNDFSKSTLRALAAKGISLVGPSGLEGYLLNDNGCGIVRTFLQVLELAK